LPAEIGMLFIKALDAAMEEIPTPNAPAGTPTVNLNPTIIQAA